MAKIVIGGVRSGSKDYTVHVVLTEQQEVEGQMVDVPIGEAFVLIPQGTEIADVKDKIVDAANQIMDRHKDSLDKRKDIEELEFPEITR